MCCPTIWHGVPHRPRAERWLGHATGAFAIPPSETNGYSGINLDFRRGVVEAKVETDIKEGMFVQPEIRAQIERVDRRCRPIGPDRGKQFDHGIGALDTGNRMADPHEIDEVRLAVV